MIVGLTGGIGSGKSTVSNLFANFGIPILSADKIGHACIAPGQAAYYAILGHFGKELLLNPDQSIDRTTFRRLIFQFPKERQWLEELLHPRIKQALIEGCAATRPNPYLILEIPLLFESNFENIPHRILVVNCDRSQQIARIQKRDQCDAETIQEMIKVQLDPQTRHQKAQDHIDNRGSVTELKPQITKWHEYYVQLCGSL
jgi:dephospho-CoA kinase